METLHAAGLDLARAIGAIFQRDSYLYWPYLVSSLVIAAAAWSWLRPSASHGWREFFDRHFSRQLWWHRSARADYWLYLANAVLVPVLFAFLLVDGRALARLMGALAGFPEPAAAEASLAARIGFTLLFFIAYDFGRFVAHCLLHDVPALWEFHKVHHSAEVLTPMTSFRAHPLELLLMAWGPAMTTGALTLAFNALSATPITFYSFLGVHALLFVSNLIGNLRHSPAWIPYGPRCGRWLVSPAHHQLHHSCEPRHLGCNRGFDLAIWDRLYGTLYVPGRKPEDFRLGLGDGTEAAYHHVGRMYALPFLRVAEQAGRLIRRSVARISAR